MEVFRILCYHVKKYTGENEMYKCPNCSAEMKYSIEKQGLYCKHCDTLLNPYAPEVKEGVAMADYYQVNKFTCNSCGAELLTEDDTMATFCSYCGAPVLLESEQIQNKYPGCIIPFQKTKEDCKKAYKKMMQKAFFAPKEMKDETHIEKFRPIYMPFVNHQIRKDGESVFKGKQVTKENGGTVTSYYDMKCQVKAGYDGAIYDGAHDFCDHLSNGILPYDMKGKRLFTPAYLSGFYADVADVKEGEYKEEFDELVKADVTQQLNKHSVFGKSNLEECMTNLNVNNFLKPEHVKEDVALCPVWFLSWRKKDRVAYAVVNGQTGKAMADLPVDRKRFLIGSVLLAIPLFLLFQMLFVMTPHVLLRVGMILSVIFAIIVNNMTTEIMLKESAVPTKTVKYLDKEKKRRKDMLFGWIIGAVCIVIELPVLLGLIFLDFPGKGIVLPIVALVILLIYLWVDLYANKVPEKIYEFDIDLYNEHWRDKKKKVGKPLLSLILSMIVLIWNPVSDFIYYGAAFVSLGLMCAVAWDVITYHNVLTTKALPQFHKRGGDHYE